MKNLATSVCYVGLHFKLYCDQLEFSLESVDGVSAMQVMGI